MVSVRRMAARYLCAILLFLTCLYTLFPTRNHYWDGIGFALNIEGVPQDERGHYPDQSADGAVYFNPNHLLYNWLGRGLYRAVQTVAPQVRALDVLVGWSIAASITTAGLLFLTALRLCGRFGVSLWLTLMFAASATWWKFSTDANVYVPSTAYLMAAAYLASMRSRPPVWAIAVLHALAMLLHQIAIWFYPAMLFLLWRRRSANGARGWRAAAVYTGVSAGLVTLAYITVWHSALQRPPDAAAFAAWIAFNGDDVLVRKALTAHAADWFRGALRVFFGGRLRLAIEHGNPAVWTLALAAIAWPAWRLRGWRPTPPPRRRAAQRDLLPWFLWLGAFLVFLSFWLTEYPYYRLFCLPPVFLLLAVWSRGRHWEPVFRAIAVVMLACNFTLYIYPLARPEASPPLHTALSARGVLRDSTHVYFADFNCDNWWVKYFNMHTRWRRTDLEDLDALFENAHGSLNAGHRVFVDTSVLKHPGWPAAVERNRFRAVHAFALVNAKHDIRFAELERSN